MKSKVNVAGHALHPMFVAIPLGLLSTSVLWDVLRLARGEPRWGVIAFWTILAGVVGGLVAAVPGIIDWAALPRASAARRAGFFHMVSNVMGLVLFAASLVLRSRAHNGYALAAWTDCLPAWIGLGALGVGGWLGGELIERYGLSVRALAREEATVRPYEAQRTTDVTSEADQLIVRP